MIAGLSTLAEAYDGVICDVWGVLHNGISPYPAAAEALARFRALGKAEHVVYDLKYVMPRKAADLRL